MIFYFILSIIISYFLSIALNRLKLHLPLNILIGFSFLIFKQFDFFIVNEWFYKLPVIFLSALFATFVLQTQNSFVFKLADDDKRFLIYTWLQFLVQWILGPLAIFLIANKNDLLALTLPLSFAGGHGSVIFVSSYVENSYKDLMLMSATIGVMLSIVGGSVISRKEWVRGHSIDKVEVMPLIIILLIVATSVLFNKFVINIPFFILSILISFIVKALKLDLNFKKNSHVLVDLLIIFSIASINILNVYEHTFLLIFISVLALVIAILNFKYVAPKILKTNRYETSLFTWGWSLGGIGLGLGLIKNLDTNKSERVFHQYARVYPYIAIVEVTLLLAVPLW